MESSAATQTRAWRLVSVVQELSQAKSNEQVRDIVKHAARELMEAEGATFVLRDNGQCYYVDEDAISPLWKGSRFPLEACISGWAMLNKDQAVIPDIYRDDRIPHDAYRPTFVKSLLMTPIRKADPIGAIGVYWANHREATFEERVLMQALADSTSVALESIALFAELEERVAERTKLLDEANARLLELSLTDELTKVHNRRGFYALAEHELMLVRRQDMTASLAFIDVDGLKRINDTLGHEAGSDVIAQIAESIRASCRESDVIGRVGGDEFAVLIVNPHETEFEIIERLEADLEYRNLTRPADAQLSISVGLVDSWVADDLEGLLKAADEAMYRAKRAKKQQL